MFLGNTRREYTNTARAGHVPKLVAVLTTLNLVVLINSNLHVNNRRGDNNFIIAMFS